jgi:putative FmdB family regulatory protein
MGARNRKSSPGAVPRLAAIPAECYTPRAAAPREAVEARERPFVGGRAVPTYDYRCDRCERTFEVRQRISAEPLTTCERCGGPIRRLLAAAPFILKGGGWYVTDYPSEGRKKGMESEKKASGEPATSPASTTSGTDGAASKVAASTEKTAASTDPPASKPSPAPTS